MFIHNWGVVAHSVFSEILVPCVEKLNTDHRLVQTAFTISSTELPFFMLSDILLYIHKFIL